MRSILSLLMVGVLAVCSLSVVGASAIAMLGGYENMDADIISAQESSESQENAAVNERATAITDKGIADAFKVDCAANGPFSGYGATLIAQGNALFAEGNVLVTEGDVLEGEGDVYDTQGDIQYTMFLDRGYGDWKNIGADALTYYNNAFSKHYAAKWKFIDAAAKYDAARAKYVLAIALR